MSKDFSIRTLGTCKQNSPINNKFFIDDDAGVLFDPTVRGCNSCDGTPSLVMQKAGPREEIFFNPESTSAAIVTCGGLCPGLNDVIRGLTMVLWYLYGIKNILGLRYGYEGITSTHNHKPIKLTPKTVEDIHKDGGTILGTSRGHQDSSEMVDFLLENKINILFTIGGDGTQTGALALTEEIEKRKLDISVIGIPKTIDNDIAYTERTFGFQTAVQMSEGPITCAHMEAKGARNGIGLVKLMGRESGFVAAYATLASSDVNLLLIPEVPFTMKKILSFLETRLQEKGHAVIVVAEGAGQDLASGTGVDKSGNKKLGDIGPFLKKSILEHMKANNISTTVKYIDPSYIIRSAPANAIDSVLCFRLAEHAVHAAMAGKTAMVVSLWNNRFVHVPMERSVESRKKIDPTRSIWQTVLHNTGQPGELI